MPWLLKSFIVLNALLLDACAFNALPRWGQAVVVVNDALFVYGGKTDEFNAFGYYTAPNTNDILYLSLSSSFSAQVPPWVVVSGSSNSSTNQGPALSWQTASADSSSQVLIFGGLPDANSDIVLVGQPDSASILDVSNRLAPSWTIESNAWAGQPSRRIRHSTATIPSGLIFIFGGEKADASGAAFSDHYVFDPKVPSFTLLPAAGGPPDLTGHVSIPLPDGRILVFGGYCPSTSILILFSTVYVLNTTTTPYTWSLLQVSSGALPSPRRAFAAVLVGPTEILIHGGSDAQLQSSMADAWILDLSQPLAVWTPVGSLTGLGARRDHFAVSSGDQVIFGFGYSQSAPAPDPIQVYDVPGSSIVPSYTPPAPSVTPAPTLPPVTSKTSTVTRSGTKGVTPTATDNPNDPHGSPAGDASKDKTTTIAVSTAFGVLALAAVVIAAAYYRRRKQRQWEQRRFWVIDGDDTAPPNDDDSQMHRDIPLAGYNDREVSETGHVHLHQALLNTIGFATLLGGSTVKAQHPQEDRARRNMLDDEDAADFGTWYNSKQREGTGSSWSLLGILGRKNREPSNGQSMTSSSPWREKSDPFSDGSSVMQDEETGFIGASTSVRPKGRRDLSYVSTRSGLSYTDPFSDAIQEESKRPIISEYEGESEASTSAVRLVPPPPALANLRTSLPFGFSGHALSPLSERTSNSTLQLQDSHSSMGAAENLTSPLSSVTSRNTNASHQGEPPRSPTLLSGLLPNNDNPVKRSDSWWSRLARRASDASTRSVHQYREIRDPNPPPRLEAIDEKIIQEKESPPSNHSNHGESVKRSVSLTHPYVARHGKSMSSVRTADSEAIEKMGAMDVVQRLHSDRRGSVDSVGTGSFSLDEGQRESGVDIFPEERVLSPLEMQDGTRGDEDDGDVTFATVQAPIPVRALTATANIASTSRPSSKSASPPLMLTVGHSSASHGAPLSPSAPSEGEGVAARVQALEKRRTVAHGPRAPRTAEERTGGQVTVDYGLVPRRSLFIANPDRRMSGSTES